MTQDERELLRNEIRSFGKWLYDYSMEGRGYGQFEPQNLSCNHNSVLHGGLGLCALALGDQPEWVSRAGKYVRGYLQYSCDETGYSYEGVGYFAYGSWGAVPFGVAMKRAGHDDIFRGIDTLPMVPNYILRQVIPWGHELVPMNDSPNRLGSSGGLMYLISRYRDPVGLWAWLKLYGNEGDGTFGANSNGYLGDGASIPYTLLFADPQLKPLSPEKVGLPLHAFFQSGRTAFRSGWGDLDSMATFTSGYDRHRGHNHRDENSFTFFARGERFAIDPGYHPNESRAHNTVLVNGKGQGRDKDEYDVHGKTLSFQELSSSWAITGDATEAFPADAEVSKARRQFLFVNAKTPYLVIADNLDTTTHGANYSWLFHTDPKNRIEIVHEENAAYVKGSRRGAVCRINFIRPDEGLSISEVD